MLFSTQRLNWVDCVGMCDSAQGKGSVSALYSLLDDPLQIVRVLYDAKISAQLNELTHHRLVQIILLSYRRK